MKSITPACIHFEKCGSCSLQHLPEDEYYLQKTDVIAKISERLGGNAKLHDIVKVGQRQRRRADFKIAVNKGKISLGFCEEKSNRVIDIEMCLVVEDEIFAMSQKLKQLLQSLKKPGNIDSISITYLSGEFDIILSLKAKGKAADAEKIIHFAQANSIARLCEKIEDEELKVLHLKTPPKVFFASSELELPAGAFLQATAAGQSAITDFILQHTKPSKNVVDLYSGCGTYSFPMAELGKEVSAYEGDYEMVMALNSAARSNGMEKNLNGQSRDLYKKPLRANELEFFDTIIINPPRNGALPQAKEIAKSGVKNVVMVSCNPQTFERDAEYLLKAGYILENIMPIDQFYWSNHLELVANFVK